MSLKQNYLEEDHQTVIRTIAAIQKSSACLTTAVLNADFENVECFLQEIDSSVRLLKAYNNRKKKRELFEFQNMQLYERRRWFR